MKHIDFSVGDKIVTVENGELRKGVIKKFFPMDPPIFVVEFEDGTVEKVLYSDMTKEPKAETPETEKNEPVEKPEITITPEKFREIAVRVVAEATKDRIVVGLAVIQIMAKIHRALFVEPWEND